MFEGHTFEHVSSMYGYFYFLYMADEVNTVVLSVIICFFLCVQFQTKSKLAFRKLHQATCISQRLFPLYCHDMHKHLLPSLFLSLTQAPPSILMFSVNIYFTPFPKNVSTHGNDDSLPTSHKYFYANLTEVKL